MDERLKRLKEIEEELHNIANSYASDETGLEATLLHLSSGNISRVINSLKDGIHINENDVTATYNNWAFQVYLIKNL